MKNNVIIAIVAATMVLVGVTFAFIMTGNPIQQSPNGQSGPQKILEKLSSPTTAGAPALGSPDAKITIVEFGDYLCTFCHRFHTETKDKLVADYVDTGKVRFIFKDFPINDFLNGGSSLGAQASYCASDQGRFWEFHDEMYDKWGGEKAGWVTKPNMEEYAKNAQVQDIDTFNSCLESGKYVSTVRDNYELARSVGLGASPSFVVIPAGGKAILVEGAQPYQTFQQLMDRLA